MNRVTFQMINFDEIGSNSFDEMLSMFAKLNNKEFDIIQLKIGVWGSPHLKTPTFIPLFSSKLLSDSNMILQVLSDSFVIKIPNNSLNTKIFNNLLNNLVPNQKKRIKIVFNSYVL